MGKIIVVHSYKGGTGKTSISVNLAATFVKQGKKVAIFDLDFRAPSLFTIFDCKKIPTIWLNDYLGGTCDINKVLIDVSDKVPNTGVFYLCPANPAPTAMRAMSTKDAKWESRALKRLLALREKLIEEKQFDYIIFDTSPGLHYSSMNAILAADYVIVATTGDCSDVEGTKCMISEFYELFETKSRIVLNKVICTSAVNLEDISSLEQRIKKEYKVPLLGKIRCDCKVVEAKGKHIFPQDYPDYQITQELAEIAAKIEKNK